MHLRMRMFPLWQQSMIVLFMVLLHLGIGAWVRGITGGFVLDWQYWMPAVVSAVIWPLIFLVLRDMRRQRMRG
jgi:rod shape-determining protein MreD